MVQHDSLALRDRLESLPQELYDEIYNLTFAAEPDTCVIINSSSSPVQLQVNQTARRQFSKSYFGDRAVFRFFTSDTLIRWLACLDKESYALVQRIELTYNVPRTHGGDKGIRQLKIVSMLAYVRQIVIDKVQLPHIDTVSLDLKLKVVE